MRSDYKMGYLKMNSIGVDCLYKRSRNWRPFPPIFRTWSIRSPLAMTETHKETHENTTGDGNNSVEKRTLSLMQFVKDPGGVKLLQGCAAENKTDNRYHTEQKTNKQFQEHRYTTKYWKTVSTN
eukprot:6469279-Amphidinium_carterae.1